MDINYWLSSNTQTLHNMSIKSARLDCLILLENVLQKPREWLLGHTEYQLSPDTIDILNTKIIQRQQHVPIAYIIGRKEFYGRDFIVNSDTLIPRPESEDSIDLLKEFAKHTKINTVIDVGTGSGCLLLTAALELTDVHLIGLDISPAALRIARQNARIHAVSAQFKVSDLLSVSPRMPKTRPYVLLANLPYVPTTIEVSPSVKAEPSIAIFSGTDGLDSLRRFWDQVKSLNNQPAAIITESLLTQHHEVLQLAKTANFTLHASRGLTQLFTGSNLVPQKV